MCGFLLTVHDVCMYVCYFMSIRRQGVDLLQWINAFISLQGTITWVSANASCPAEVRVYSSLFLVEDVDDLTW